MRLPARCVALDLLSGSSDWFEDSLFVFSELVATKDVIHCSWLFELWLSVGVALVTSVLPTRFTGFCCYCVKDYYSCKIIIRVKLFV